MREELSTIKASADTLTCYERNEFWWRSSSAKSSARVLLIAIVLIATSLRLNQLGADGLWVDEIITETLSRLRLQAMLEMTRNADNHPPLFYMVSSLGRPFGDTDFAARIPAAFAGILSIPMVFVLARRLQKHTFTGLVASLLVATVPFHLRLSQEARSYTLAILLQMATMYWLYRGLFENWKWAWLGYALTMIAGWYVHYFAFLWLAAQGLFVLLIGLVILFRRGPSEVSSRLGRLRRVLVPFAASLFVCALAYLPWYSTLFAHTQLLMGLARLPAREPGPSSIDLTVLISIWQAFAEHQSVLAIALAVAAIAGLMLGLIRRAWAATTYIAVSFVAPALMMGTMSTAPYFNPKYGFPLLVPVLLFASQGLAFPCQAAVTAFRRVSPPVTGSALLLIVAAFMIPFGSAYYRDQKEDWRAVGQFLESCMGPEDALVLFNVKLYVGYYSPRTADRTWPASSLDDLRKAYATGRPLWVLQNPYLGQVPDAAQIRDWVAQQPGLKFDFGLGMYLYYLHSGQTQAGLQEEMKQCRIPSRPRLWAGEERAAREAAQAAAVAGDLTGARSIYARLLASNLTSDERFEVLMAWAIMERFRPNPPAALDLLEQALRLQPDDVEAHANYGAVLLDANRPADAAREFEFVVSRNPQHFWGYWLGGLAYQRMGQLDQALVALQRAVDLAPDEATRADVVLEIIEVAAQAKNCTVARDFVRRHPSIVDKLGEQQRAFLAACP